MPPFFEHQDEASFSTCSGMEHKRAQHEQKPRRCVRFASFHETCEISHIEDMPQDVIENVWMSADELSFLRTSCATIIMNIEEALAAGICVRGLEKHVPEYVEDSNSKRRQIYDTIHAVQEFQATTGVTVPEDLIADSCQQVSVYSEAVAQIQGINDAIEAFNQ